ncbi:MAG: tetratricopeptide repeat protein [Chloroflexota bacterium]|nr:tetratricopeptide repeat protein [Chloroflexota bacterium]MDE3102416.1 tetratricopeptide repeat protein [Chloroflexota bacterium]
MATTPSETTLRARTLSDQAIAAALEADWPRAVELNKQILDTNPEEAEAGDRYGRALLELGRLDEAKAAYQEVLKAYPHDPIALRQIARVAILAEEKRKADPTRSKTQTRLFIEDMGKTGILRVVNPAPGNVLARYSPGAEAALREQEGLLAVHAHDGMLLGFLEPKVGRRLIELIRSGNEYVVAIVTNDPANPRVAVREVVQSPQNADRISFPGHHRPVETKERAYIKGTFFRYGEEDLEATEEEEEEETAGETEAEAGVAADEELPEEPLPVEADGDDAEDEEEGEE